MNLLLCYDNEGVYVNTMGRVSKNFVLQWGEMPTSVAYIGTGQIMGWGNKAIEVRSTQDCQENLSDFQSPADTFRRDGSLGRRFHAQESAAP
jgi:hypothetical protein